jgi:hypothetical protein
MPHHTHIIAVLFCCLVACSKKSSAPAPTPQPPGPLVVTGARLNGVQAQPNNNYNVPPTATIRLSFNNRLDRGTVANAVSLRESNGTAMAIQYGYDNNDSTLVLTSAAPLKHLTRYSLQASTDLQSAQKGPLNTAYQLQWLTQIDSSDKFPLLTDNALLDLLQQQTFRYFWDYGHPVSGLARERSNATPETVTSGGSGFGIMAIPVAVHRNFISRAQGLAKLQQIVGFLKNTAQTFHGAFPHWLNGTTGAAIPFSQKDNGADLVETSFLMAGLLAARQYFNGGDVAETTLRNDINQLWRAVEWSWFRKNNENVLYWHWSPNYGWEMNHKIQGWNECLITYIMAASSPTHPIPATVYKEGFARNGAMANGNSYFGHPLPLGPAQGGPLFWSHYSFLGINPNGLSDMYANYQTQVVNHSRINYAHCVANPKNFFGYSAQCWGLTASDVPNGYAANEPSNDIGVISPTAALSSFPFTPAESMAALKFFYYKLGDKLWTQYGLVDAFSLQEPWFAPSHLAIDQGPIIIMVENYRSQLVWNLLTSCPEIKNGMKNVLGFSAPYL